MRLGRTLVFHRSLNDDRVARHDIESLSRMATISSTQRVASCRNASFYLAFGEQESVQAFQPKLQAVQGGEPRSQF